MDGRTPRPAGRMINHNSNTAAPRQAATPSSAQEEPTQEIASRPSLSPQTPSSPRPPRRFRRWPIVAIAGIIILGLAGWLGFSVYQNANTGIDSSKYQAVFFTNGQVYFGKLQSFNGDYLKLNDIYYLQTDADETTDSQNPQQTTANQGEVQLIKLGNEIHGPEDEMIISKDQVLFYENLRPDGNVSQSIQQARGNN
jgi:hypothetical protein